MADPHDNSCVNLDYGDTSGLEPPCRNALPNSVNKRQRPGTTPRTRLPAMLVAVALTIMVLMSACGPDAPADSLTADQTDLATPATVASQERTTPPLTATATPVSQATSTSTASPVPDPTPTSSGSTRNLPTTPAATPNPESTRVVQTPRPTQTAAPVPTAAPAVTPAAPEPTAAVPKPPYTPAPMATPAATLPQPSSGNSVQTDREALTALYNATSGRFWTTGRKENWLTDSPLGEWHGVRTDRNGRVIVLNLSGAGLIGEIPPQLGNLDLLWSLSLRRNQLTGEVPQEVFDLPNVEEFYSWEGNNLVHPDREALQALYDATQGDKWKHKWEWRHDYPIPRGVRTNAKGRVTVTDLSQQDLRGQLPPEIGDLT